MRALAIFCAILHLTHVTGASLGQNAPSFLQASSEVDPEKYNDASVLQTYPFFQSAEGPVVEENWMLANNWDLVDFLKHRIEEIILRKHAPEFQQAHAECAFQISDKWQRDHDNQMKLKNVLWTFCYKDGKESTLYSVLQGFVHIFAKELKECHQLMEMDGIEKLLDDIKAFNEFLTYADQQHAANKELEKNEASDENRAEANTQDPLMQARQAYHLPNFFGWLAAQEDVKNSFFGLTELFNDMVTRFHEDEKTMSSDYMYTEVIRQNRANTVEMLKITAAHAADLCSQNDRLYKDLNIMLPVLTDMVDALAAVMNDDTFP